MMHPAVIGRKANDVLSHPATWLITLMVGYFAGMGVSAGLNNVWIFVAGVVWAALCFIPTAFAMRRDNRKDRR